MYLSAQKQKTRFTSRAKKIDVSTNVIRQNVYMKKWDDGKKGKQILHHPFNNIVLTFLHRSSPADTSAGLHDTREGKGR